MAYEGLKPQDMLTNSTIKPPLVSLAVLKCPVLIRHLASADYLVLAAFITSKSGLQGDEAE